MKRAILAILAAVALTAPALAQSTTTVTTTGAANATSITVAPEQRTRIKGYITEHKVRPVTVKERITVGATLPADVELLAVPGDWGPSLHSYRYVYSGDDVVLVDPTSRRVVQVID
jgi:hypothetical protein